VVSRWVCRLLWCCAAGFGFTAVWLWLMPAPNRPFHCVDKPDNDLGVCSPGEHEVVFHVSNQSSQPSQILGLAEGCGVNCCYKSKYQVQMTVPPGGAVGYPCLISVRAPGKFEARMVLFLEVQGLRELPLTVRGVGAVRGDNTNGTTAP
jgi:hypothetical protein